MPISRLVKYGVVSTVIFIGSTVAVQAQSDLPGCADDVVKQVALEIVIEGEEKSRKELNNNSVLIFYSKMDWQLNSLQITNIALEDVNERTGKLLCRASLEGQKDRVIFNNMPEPYQIDRSLLEETGYWDWQNIFQFQYEIYESAEDPEYFIVNVLY